MDSKLFYGDNLAVLRESVRDETVDLIYLDPPFNSQATYNVLFKKPTGEPSDAQAEAFLDTWTWGPTADAAYEDVIRSGGRAARILSALFSAFGKSDMMAYLAMMTLRLEELHHKLTPTGTLYLHCDPTASHYLKVILDGIFSSDQFLNEVIWKRTSAHNSANRYGSAHDTLLVYTRGPKFTWNTLYGPYDDLYVDSFFTHTDKEGRRWRRTDLTGPGTRKGDSGLPWRHYNPTDHGRHWQPPSYFYDKYTELTGDDLAKYDLIDRFEKLDQIGLIHWPQKARGMPQGKRLLVDAPGIPLQDIWTDIKPMHNMSKERLGYPTQKPLALLERIIGASSNPGNVVLDPFCGCGTTVEAAERLGRQWIGIDVTHYAISLIEARLRKNFPKTSVIVDGRPEDYAGACDLAARSGYQFQWWANWLLQVQDYRERKKGADRGIDGTIYFPNGPKGVGRVIVSVKSGANLNVSMVRDLHGTIAREEAEMGVLVTLHEPTQPMQREVRQAGIVKTAPGTFPKLQLLWIKEWFEGRRPEMPRPFEPAKLRLVAREQKASDDGQLGFTFSIPGGKADKRKDEVVYTDPRVAFAD